jgi:protoporphyrinogen oxidase
MTWGFADQHLIDLVSDKLCRIGVIYKREILDATVCRLVNAYPVLEVGIENKLAALNAYFQNFKNLTHSGRNGCFQYIHIHELMQSGKRIVEDLTNKKRLADGQQ